MNKNFILLALTQFFSILNDNLIKNAIVTIAIFINSSNISFPAIAGGLFVLPYILFSSISGEISDKYNKAVLIKILKITEFITFFIALLSIYFQNHFLMFLSVFLLGIQTTMISPIRLSIIPKIVSLKHLTTANGIIDGSGFIGVLCGTLMGTYICKYPNYFSYISVITIISFCVSLISSLFLKSPDNFYDIKINKNIYRSTIEHCKEIIKFNLEKECYILSYFWLICSLMITMFPNIVKYNLHLENQYFTMFLFIFTIGMGIGSFVSNIFPIKNISTIIVFSKVMLIILSLSVLFENIIAIGLSLFCVAFFSSIYSVRTYTYIQTHVEEHHIGRIFSAINIYNAIFMILGACGLLIASYCSLPYYLIICLLAFL